MERSLINWLVIVGGKTKSPFKTSVIEAECSRIFWCKKEKGVVSGVPLIQNDFIGKKSIFKFNWNLIKIKSRLS